MVRLGDVCDVRDGTHDSPKYVYHGFPLVTSKNVVNGYIDITDVNYISEADYNKIIVRSGVDDGDIIMPMIGTIGNPVVVHKTFDFAIKNVALVKFIGNNVLNRYVLYILTSTNFKNYIERENRGGTQKFISLGNIRNFTLPLPPLEAQKQIAKTLDTAAEILAMRKQQLAELDNLIESTFYEMFGDLVANEKKWKVEKLDSVFKESPQNGLYKPASAYTNDNLGTPILRIDSFYSGKLKQPLTLKRLYCTQKEIDVYSLSEDDIVINRVNSIEYLGKCAHIKGLLERTVFESNMMRLKVNDTIINSIYLTKFLCTPYIYDQILSHAKKAVNQASINQKDVQDLNILVPPISLQTKFAENITKMERQRSLVEKTVEETQYLFDSLMSEYFE